MRAPLVAASVLAALATGCADDEPTTTFAIRSLDGNSPYAGVSRALTYTRSEDFTRPVNRVEFPLSTADPAFALEYLPARYASAVTVELWDETSALRIGGTPYFRPEEGGELDVVVGTPGTCAVAPSMQLSTAREGAAAVMLGRHVIVAGGVDAGGPSAAVDAFDVVTSSGVSIAPAPAALGRTKAAKIDSSRVLLVGESGAAFVLRFDAQRGSTYAPIVLHTGSATAASVVSFPTGGAAVVGGGDGITPVDAVSWVTPSEAVETIVLNYSGVDRVSGASGVGLYALSWSGDLVTYEHIHTAAAAPVRRLYFDDGPRHGAHMMMLETGIRMMILGGTDDLGAVRADAFAVRDCPIFCAYTRVNWTTARPGVTVANEGVVVGGDPPSDLIDEVVFRPTDVILQSFGTLGTPRSAPAVARLPSGPAYVFGGRTPSGFTASTELCFGRAR